MIARDPRHDASRTRRSSSAATRTPGPTGPTTTSSGFTAVIGDRPLARAGCCRAAGVRSARSSWPAGTARSTACSARPSGASSSRDDLTRNAVAYINMDGVSGRSFGGGGVPSTDKLMTDVTKTVPDPGGGSVYDDWRGDAAAPTLDRLGSGSDYTVLLDHLGVPSMEVGMSTRRRRVPLGLRRHVPDRALPRSGLPRPPGGVAGVGVTRAAARRTRTRCRCATPTTRRRSTPTWPSCRRSSRPTRRRAGRPDVAARGRRRRGARRRRRWRRTPRTSCPSDSPRSGQLRRVNSALMREERLLTTPVGIPGRPWFRHQVYAPGINTGYAAQFLPGIRDALDAGDDGDGDPVPRPAARLAAPGRPQVAVGRLRARRTAAAPRARSTAKAAAAARRSARESAAQPAP